MTGVQTCALPICFPVTIRGEKRYITEIVAENVQFLEWGDKNKAPETNNTYEPEGLDSDGFRALDDADVPF